MKQLKMICCMRNIPQMNIEDGYKIRKYKPGDEAVWTEICKNGLLSENDGIECWEKCMLSEKTLVPEKDVFFVCDQNGSEIATCTAFVNENGYGIMHMLAAKPEARGHGLGYAMTAFSLAKLDKELTEDKRLVFLSTDDWRISAVKAYLNAGFQPVLYDVDMDKRWKAVCEKLDIHGVEMLYENGESAGIVL